MITLVTSLHRFSKQLISLLTFFLAVTLVFGTFLPSVRAQEEEPVSVTTPQQKNYQAVVTKILTTGTEPLMDQLVPYQELEINITSGDKKNETVQAKNSAGIQEGSAFSYQEYKVGDKIRLTAFDSGQGEIIYTVAGKSRREGLLTLGILFVVVVLIVGKLWGALSIAGLAISFLVIFNLIIPMIIEGKDPIIAAIIGSIIIIPLTFYVSHGWNKKTHVGVVATLVSLILTGVLAVYFVNATHLTGFASEEAGFLQVERQGSIDIRGLLLAGIIIGTLGILDDITIGQASVVRQIKKSKPDISFRELFKRGMSVGQDHISSMVNTLVLVYSGSALPLLLMFFGSQNSLTDVLEYELITEEIVRMLVGSIGLVLAAPLATAIAAFVFSRETEKKSRHTL